MVETQEKIKYLIADTTAFLNAVPLNDYAENVLTVPDVIAEVRNKRQIRRLCVLPFDLQVREPQIDNVKYCVEFAKKTGDYASLSGIDIKVIALTYELEKDNVGTQHLRNEPIMPTIIASKNKPEEFQDNTKLAGWYNPKDGEESEDDFSGEEIEDNNEKNSQDVEVNSSAETEAVDVVKEAIEARLAKLCDLTEVQQNTELLSNEQNEISQKELEELFEKLRCEKEDEADYDLLLAPQVKSDNDEANESDQSSNGDTEHESLDKIKTGIDNEEDGGWITPANIKKVKKSFGGTLDDVTPIVACMSTDYALQNVLKQLNLQILALNGRVIKQLRTYILRCYACFKTTSIMTKVFCPKCGNKTLKRVAVSLDENGKQVIHINTRRPLTAKYKNQSIPRFQGGKHSRNPILFEDQPIPRQMPSRVAKTKTNALNEDYTAGFSPFATRDVDSKSAILRSKGHLKEWARNNTFEEDRRKKHYNRLYK